MTLQSVGIGRVTVDCGRYRERLLAPQHPTHQFGSINAAFPNSETASAASAAASTVDRFAVLGTHPARVATATATGFLLAAAAAAAAHAG